MDLRRALAVAFAVWLAMAVLSVVQRDGDWWSLRSAAFLLFTVVWLLLLAQEKRQENARRDQARDVAEAERLAGLARLRQRGWKV
ncbi:hypothetical protein ASD11_07755 [Aeromicrobium sp. Root495]|uniref:hypothetical protein n=1 Tax=Aeromicrobium sp. Root495 TaxID=1736550 RepID=UPI0006FCDB18|nr:hypothetical protein [Aeromicrobium sp. Root495]KQY59449.1 hypothetical protein ASD11_07755 [Aeromicrobium sp. Root495]